MNPYKFIKCVHCGYEWWTKSTARTVSCPHCGGKAPNPNEKTIPAKVDQ